MSISIDLLPLEFKQENIKKAKFYKIQAIGVFIILFVVFVASLTVALRFLQSQRISQVNESLTENESKIADLQGTENLLILLKNRLTTINEYLGIASTQVKMYDLIDKLLPSSISLTSVSVNNKGEILLSATTLSGDGVDELVERLTDPEINEDKISSVSLENLNRGRDGIYRMSFKITPK